MDFDFGRKVMRRFFAAPENFSRSEVELNADESRHLRDVLRLRAGENVRVFDGKGSEYLCVVQTFERRAEHIKLILHEQIEPPAPESDLNLTLAAALLKNEKFDLVVQKAVELGANKIVPLETARADVKLSDARDRVKKIERWRRIALEAAKQSGRAVIPRVETPIAAERFLANLNQTETNVFFHERAGESLSQQTFGDIAAATVIVGAEGGWETAETEIARAHNCRVVTLGGRILRAETAAIVVVALMQHLFGDLR